MTKTELIAEIAGQLDVSKKLAGEFVNAFTSTVMKGVKEDKEVRIQGFGTYKLSHREAREGVNPQDTSKKIQIPARNVVGFKVGTEFKKAVN